MAEFLPVDEQMKILMSGTEYGDETMRQRMEAELRERLKEGRPLRVYLGVDPTAPDIHLGHTVPLRKLGQFQALGHDVTFLIGNFTALIGDPSDKDRTRPQLGVEQVAENVRTYTEQAWKILDPERTRIRFNAEWLGEMNFADVIRLASNFTVQQFLQRDNFAKRHDKGDAIFLHEFFYALMQGYDAVAQETDVQVGGTDQTFNLLAGRTLQERAGQKPQIALTTPMLPGTDGTMKMSKSLGNSIPIDTTPEDMYGKVMSIPDEAMPVFYRLVTPLHPDEQARIIAELQSGQLHPRDAKMRLARLITGVFHGEEGAASAEAHFVRVFQQQKLPEEMPERVIQEPIGLLNLITEAGFARGTGEARRLIQQNAVSLGDEKVTDQELVIQPSDQPRILRVGKRNFLRLV
jgi:tyrosyl-tRNA synthetase